MISLERRRARPSVAEVNGNPGTGIIDVTDVNYFVDLVKHIEEKTGNTAQKKQAEKTKEEKPQDSGNGEEEARITEYRQLKAKQAQKGLTLTEHARLTWLHAHVSWWK